MRSVVEYINKCSYGDWFVLCQMSRNMNQRFFCEFLTLLSRTINPEPEIEYDDEEGQEEEDVLPPLALANRERKTSFQDIQDRLKPGLNKYGRNNVSSLTLHSKVCDLTPFDTRME